MRRLIFFLAVLLQFSSYGQTGTVKPLGSTNPNDINRVLGKLQVDSIVKLLRYANTDTCKVLGVASDGSIVLRDKCIGGIAYVDSNVFVTMTRLIDSLAAIRASVSGADSNVYSTVTRLRDSINALEARILAKGYLTTETDPTVSTVVKSITGTQIVDWDAHLTDYTNPHNTTLDQVAKKNPVTDTSLFIGWQDPGGIISLFGNSITADIYTNPPPVPYYRHLAYRHGQTVKVHAHGGATYYRGYTPHNNNGALMDSVASLEVMPTPNSKLIIELGFNDGCQYATSYDTTQIKLSLDSFVYKADTQLWTRNNIGAISAWPIPNPALCSSMTATDLIIINTAIRNECARLGIHYIDIHTIFNNNQKRNLYFTDNVHWSALGHYICADEADKEMYPQVYVKGNLLVDGGLYDYRGHQIVSVDTSGRKVIEGETGFDVLPDGKALVTVPFTKNYAGLRASGVTFQGLSTYNYFIGFNLHHNGTTYVTDTPGYSGMIQFADGEISYWQSTGSNTAGAAPTLEKRYKFSSNSRGFGFGGNPGNGGRDDFSGSAMQGDASKLQFNFATKFKYAPANADALFEILVRHTPDSNTQTISSLPYSFIANRLKYSGGAAFYVPVFSSSDSLVASHIEDSAGHISIGQNPLSYSYFTIPYSDSMLSARIGFWNFGSISNTNMYITNNSYFKKGTGTIAIYSMYDMGFGLYNSAGSGGACFLIGGTPYLQTAGSVRGQYYAYFKVTNWGTVAAGAHASTANNDSLGCSLIITNTSTDPSTRDSVYFPNLASWSGTSKGYAVIDLSGSHGKIPNKRLDYVPTIPVADVIGAVDTIYRKPGTDSVMIRRNGVVSFAYKDSLSSSASVAWGSITGTVSSQTDLQSALNAKQDALGFTAENIANKATSFVTVNNTLYPSVQAVKTYVDNAISGLSSVYAPIIHTHGMSDLTAFNITTPAAGHILTYNGTSGKWENSAPSFLTSSNIEDAINDAVTNKAPSENAVFDALALKQNSLGYTAENTANKATSFGTVNNTLYPTVQACSTYIAGLNYITNAVTSLSNLSTVGTITSGTWQASTISSTYLDKSITINAQTGTTYTLQASDLGKIVQCTNASAITVTLPSGLGASFWCIIKQGGAGAVTLAASGTTIHNRQSYTKTAGQYASFIIMPESTSNNYSTQGDMQ